MKNGKIIYEDKGSPNKRILYGVYSKEADITTILKDTVNKANEEIISTEVKGFYFGKPDPKYLIEYYGALKAEYN